MTVWAIKHRTFVNNFAYETAEINIEVKHLLGQSTHKNRIIGNFTSYFTFPAAVA
jgi:hypothetical protein